MLKIALSILLLLILGCSKNPSAPFYDASALISQQTSLVDFGSLSYNQAVIKTIAIINDSPLSTTSVVSPIISEPSSSNYSIVYKNNCDKVLKSQEKCLVKVQVKNNAQGGVLSADLIAQDLVVSLTAQAETISSSIVFKKGQQSISSLNLGIIQNTSTQQINIFNNSKVSESLGVISILGDFLKLSDSCSNKVLPANKSCSVLVGFSPLDKSDGLYSGSLTVNSFSLPLSVQVQGGKTSNPIADLVFLENNQVLSNLNFGAIKDSKIKVLSIKNTGNTILSLSANLSQNKFSIIYSSCNEPLLPNKICALRMFFDARGASSGNISDTLNIGGKNLPIIATIKPVVTQAYLIGPSIRLNQGIYYTSENLGQEILPQVSVSAPGHLENTLNFLYSTSSSCSNGQNISNFPLISNSLNPVYVQVSDPAGGMSDCTEVGSFVHDSISPQITFNTSGGNQNLTGSSANLNVEFSVSELYKNKYSYELIDAQNCAETGQEFSSLDLMASNYLSLPLVNQVYRSIKIKANDLAGNESQICSPNYIFGLPTQIQLTVPSNVKVYETIQSYSGIVKDITGAPVANTNLQISDGETIKNLVSNGSGSFSFQISSSTQLSQSELLNLKRRDSNSQYENKITVTALANLSASSSHTYEVIRRSCQEYALFDGVSINGVYPIDFDLDGNSVSQSNIDCRFDSGKDLENVPFTDILNRAKISRSLRSTMGVERINFNVALESLTGETGPSGAVVNKLVNEERIRFVGPIASGNPYGEQGHVVDILIGSFIEVTFYGTGLNILSGHNSAYDMRIRVNQGVESGNLVPSSIGINLDNRKYAVNRIIPGVKNLPLGLHTVRIRNASTTNNMRVNGIEILNESSNIAVYNGGKMDFNQLIGITTPRTSSYNEGIVGAKGGRVVKYVKNNELLSIKQEVDSSINYLGNTNHINEEVVHNYQYRIFGSGRVDDFSTVNSTFSGARFFTLNDGTTTLAAQNITGQVWSGQDVIINGSSSPAQPFVVYFTFVGTGLDVSVLGYGPTSRVTNVIVDGVSVGNLPTVSNGVLQQLPIVSGLPFGTHIVRFESPGISGQTAPHFFSRFIVYQPKKPTLPIDSLQVDDYNVMANFSNANRYNIFSNIGFTSELSQGVIRKQSTREITYIGSWPELSVATSGHVASNSGGVEVYTTTNGNSIKYTFWGTGFVFGVAQSGTGVRSFNLNVDGSSFNTANLAYGLGSNSGGGNYQVPASARERFSISGLSLGIHSITITNTSSNGVYFYFDALDIISPIYRYP